MDPPWVVGTLPYYAPSAQGACNERVAYRFIFVYIVVKYVTYIATDLHTARISR
jgi:hypothetical protein